MYAVIGANGYLGSYMIKHILASTNEKVLAVARHVGVSDNERVCWAACDITNPGDVEELTRVHFLGKKDHKIIYLAAYHHPDLVAKNPRLAWDTNVTALSRFLNMVEDVKCLFYPSSDSVYGESFDDHYFTEEDGLNPVNRYGRHKCVAETLVTAYGYNVVRFPFLIAPSIVPGKKHFYDAIAETIQQGKVMEMFADSYRSALSFDTAAQLTVRLMESYREEYPKILNVCGDDALSKYDVGLMIADKLGVSRDLIKPISVNDASGIFEAKRASSTLMDNGLLKQTLGLDEVKLVL